MSENENPTPEAEPAITDADNEVPSESDELAEGEEVIVDAMTGEVTTLSAEEAAAEEAAEKAQFAVSVLDVPEGISPELVYDPYGEEILSTSKEDFESLLEQFSGGFQAFREGEIVNATVLRVTDTVVILEFGFKSEGSVAVDEFKDAPVEGEEVEVLLESLEDDDGVVVLSKKKADFLRVWEKIREAHEADRSVKGTLVRKIKGGVTVDLMGVDAFLPGSQIALRRVPNIEDLIGEVYKFKIIKLNKRRRNIVVSRRVILEGEREKKRETLVKELLVGQVREGTVKNITDFGAFIDLGGLDGLLHITDMSWGRVGHPTEMIDIGAKIDVKLLDIDWNRERISLGLKQLLPYPWTDIGKKYPVGARVRGRVVSITNYGAFIELEKGVEGLVHISEMSWTRNVRHPSKVVSIGESIEAVVLKVDAGDEKISLGMKQIEEDPWLALPVKYPSGTKLAGVVRNLTSFGAFVEIEAGIDGLVHVSDMSWTKRVEHPSEVVEKGQDVDIIVLDVDAENKRISLGVKQLVEDPWPKITEQFSPGLEPEGTVVRVQDDGLVIDLGDDIEGFISAAGSGVDDQERLDEYYARGDALSLKVIESDATNRHIELEVTEVPDRKTQEEIEAARIAAVEEAAAVAAAHTESEAESDDDFRLRPGQKADSVEEDGATEVATLAPAAERAAELQAQAAAEAKGDDAEPVEEEATADESSEGDDAEPVEEEATADESSEGDDAEPVEEEG